MRCFGKVHIEAPLLAGWLTWCNAKRNWGNLPQMEGRRPQVQLHCGEHPHYHTADHSKLDQRAFYAPGPCICDLYLLSADHLVKFPKVARWFFRKPSWFSMMEIIVEGISFKFSKVIPEDWRFWEPIQALYGRYKTNYCPRNCSQTRIVAWISMNHNSFLLKVKSLMCIALFILCKVYVYLLLPWRHFGMLDVKTKTISYQCSGAFLKSTFSKVGEENVFYPW